MVAPVSEATSFVAADVGRPDPGELLVRAGADAMRVRGGRPLPALSADEGVAKAKVPKSTLYQLWANFDDYRREVLIELLRTAEPEDAGGVIEAVVPVLERGGHPQEILLTASTAYFDRFRESDTFRWLMAAYPHREEAAVGVEIAKILNGARDRFSHPLALMFAAAQRRPREGLDVAQISQLLVAIYLGMAIRERLDPGSARAPIEWRDGSGEAEEWPRVAVAVQAVVARCTEPVAS